MNQQGHGGAGRAAFSIIFGIVGIIVAIFIPTGGGIAGFILGIISIALGAGARRHGAGGLAVFGLILGIISVLLGLRGVLLCIGVISCASCACAALA